LTDFMGFDKVFKDPWNGNFTVPDSWMQTARPVIIKGTARAIPH